MPKKQRKRIARPPKPPRAVKISSLRQKLDLNQEEFGKRLRASAMAVSRWERGVQAPASRSFVELGNLAGDPDCWYFWERAGLRNEDILRVVPMLRKRLRAQQSPNLEIVAAGVAAHKLPPKKLQLVAIPLLSADITGQDHKDDDFPLLQTPLWMV